MAVKTADTTEPKRGFTAGDAVLSGLFAALVIACGIALTYDFRALLAEQEGYAPGTPARFQPAPLRSPGTDDQLRPYDPSSAPRLLGEPVDLPGFDGNPQDVISQPMSFHMGEGGEATAIGRITLGSFSRFEDFLAENENLARITFHSPGGSVRDAVAMADLIRANDLNTALARNGYCASSCPLAFSGGVERTAPDPVWFGVHQVFTSDAEIGTLQEGMAGAQHISSQAQQLLDDMGVDPRAWIHAMATPKEQLYLFTPEEMTDYRWITGL